MSRKLTFVLSAVLLATTACAGTDPSTAAFSASTCKVALPSDLRISQIEETALMIGGGVCGLKTDPTLRAHLVRVEKGDDELMHAVLSITSEE